MSGAIYWYDKYDDPNGAKGLPDVVMRKMGEERNIIKRIVDIPHTREKGGLCTA